MTTETEGSVPQFVVATCHEGSDWSVRPATDAEVADPEDETLPLAEARAFAAEVAAEHGTRWFDFSGDSVEAEVV